MSDWRYRGACRDEDPELFYPLGHGAPAQVEQAKAVCRRCDVKDTCLKWALESGEDFGIWGGLTEDERREVKRRATARPPQRDCADCGETFQPGLASQKRCVPCRMPPLKPCGTEAAYRRHMEAGERPCDACATARREYRQAARAKAAAK